MEAINDYATGAIKLYHTEKDIQNSVRANEVLSIDVFRRCAGRYNRDTEWTLAGTRKIFTSEDLRFIFVDYSARSGEDYEYQTRVEYKKEGIKYYSNEAQCSVHSQSCGIVIGAGDEWYTLNFNVSYNTQRQYNMSYIKPYYSKYPHAIQNGDANFNNGSISGYFNMFDNQCSIERRGGHFAEIIEDFLTDGRIKTLKTYDGYVWRVQIDSPIKRERTNSRDMVYFTFNWHAVAPAVPTGYFEYLEPEPEVKNVAIAALAIAGISVAGVR